jgi:hypothetical protein
VISPYVRPVTLAISGAGGEGDSSRRVNTSVWTGSGDLVVLSYVRPGEGDSWSGPRRARSAQLPVGRRRRRCR